MMFVQGMSWKRVATQQKVSMRFDALHSAVIYCAGYRHAMK